MGKPSKDYAVPLWEKANLTVYEAAAYSGIGADKLRELSDREDCEFVLWNGTKRLIKRKKLDEFLERAYGSNGIYNDCRSCAPVCLYPRIHTYAGI